MSQSSQQKESLLQQRAVPLGKGSASVAKAASAEPNRDADSGLPFDPWRLLDVLTRAGPWLLLGAILIAGALLKVLPKKDQYIAIVKFILREPPLGIMVERPAVPIRNQAIPPLVSAALAGAWLNREVIAGVAEKFKPPQTEESIAASIEVAPPDPNDTSPDVIKIKITRNTTRQECLDLAKLYSRELVAYTRKLQVMEAREAGNYFKLGLVSVDRELEVVNGEIKAFLQEANLFDYDKETDAFLAHRGQLDRDYHTARIEADTVDLKIKSLAEQIIQMKQGELENLKTRYTEEHPVVEERRALLEVMKRQLMNIGAKSLAEMDAGSPMANGLFLQILNLQIQKVALRKQSEELAVVRDRVNEKLSTMSKSGMEYGKMKARMQSLQVNRSLLANRLREAQLIEENSLGYLRALSEPSLPEVGIRFGWIKPVMISAGAALAFFLLGCAFFLIREVLDDRIITVPDLKRATRLPILATLTDLNRLSSREKSDSGFKAWTQLTGRLGDATPEKLICGFTSLLESEGCSTWIKQLAESARQRDLPVVILSLRTPNRMKMKPNLSVESSNPKVAGDPLWLEKAVADGLQQTTSIRSFSIPVDWEWNAEHLQQWRRALEDFSRLERGVVLIELPVIQQPESIILAETVPRLVWLSSSGKVRCSATRATLDLLRFARCNFAGAVLNREPRKSSRSFFARWLPHVGLFALVNFSCPIADAQSLDTLPTATNTSGGTVTHQLLSVASKTERALWQQKLTLGPGDVLNISLYGDSSLSRSDLVIAGDGRITYLQASEVQASGLTIDELRAAIQDKLRPYYRNPRVMISPSAFRSKKFVILGAVNQKGVYTLDRPLSLIEAVARAKGLSSGYLSDNRVAERTDFAHSFLARGGEHKAIDFERLFLEGDLTQNISMEPNDFLYFAPAARDEIYILGAIASPGITPFTPETTLMSAIASRGGFGGGAYQAKVLIIRGSLRRPETYIVNATEILKGKAPDFRLQQKDIVFVNSSPWAFVGQILNMAISSYTYGVEIVWTGENITRKVINTQPYIPGL